MRTHSILLALLFAVALAPRVHAADAADTTVAFAYETGRFFVVQKGEPVATERYQYDRVADSMMVSAVVERRLRAADGSVKPYRKKVGLVMNVRDHVMRRYNSNVDFDGHTTVKGVLPGDTVMTVYTEIDGGGTADRLVQPPGRLFVMDPLVFSLFDVLCREVSGHVLGTRPVQLVTLGQSPTTSEAKVTDAGADTVMWAGKRTVTHRYLVTDASTQFLLWAAPDGRMLRLEHHDSGLVVQREEPATPRPARKSTSAAPKKSAK